MGRHDLYAVSETYQASEYLLRNFFDILYLSYVAKDQCHFPDFMASSSSVSKS